MKPTKNLILKIPLEPAELSSNLRNVWQARILHFWDITKARLAAAEADVRQVSLEMEEQRAEHAVAIKAYRDRIRSLVMLHRRSEADAKFAAAVEQEHHVQKALTDAVAATDKHHIELRKTREAAQRAYESQARAALDYERKMKEQCAEFENKVSAIHEQYEARLAEEVRSTEERCVTEVFRAAAQRDAAVEQLEDRHQMVLQQAREHHAATVASHLELVAHLKSDLDAARAGTHFHTHRNKGDAATA